MTIFTTTSRVYKEEIPYKLVGVHKCGPGGFHSLNSSSHFNSSVLYLYINKYACIWVDNIILINMNVKHIIGETYIY